MTDDPKLFTIRLNNENNDIRSNLIETKKKPEEISNVNQELLNDNEELEKISSYNIKDEESLQNNASEFQKKKLNILLDKNYVAELINKIKFYQDDNARLSNDLFNIKKKYNKIKDYLNANKKEKDDIYKKIQELNNSLINNNIVETPFFKERSTEVSIDTKTPNDTNNAESLNKKKSPKSINDLDQVINDIFG
jgi:chromosome segregation ATPase